jgi:ribonuclease P protein component
MIPAIDNRNTFKKKHRISKSSNLYLVYNKGRRISLSWISLSYIKRNERATISEGVLCKSFVSSMIGVFIKRKVFKNSIQRNYFKRCVHEFFRCHKRSFSDAYDIVVCAEKRFPIYSRSFIRKGIEELFMKGDLT